MPRLPRTALLVLAALALIASASRADRRYFVDSYTSYLAPAGTLEMEMWSTALSGQGDSTNTSWANRVEFEYAITHRLTGVPWSFTAHARDLWQVPGGAVAERIASASLAVACCQDLTSTSEGETGENQFEIGTQALPNSTCTQPPIAARTASVPTVQPIDQRTTRCSDSCGGCPHRRIHV